MEVVPISIETHKIQYWNENLTNTHPLPYLSVESKKYRSKKLESNKVLKPKTKIALTNEKKIEHNNNTKTEISVKIHQKQN